MHVLTRGQLSCLGLATAVATACEYSAVDKQNASNQAELALTAADAGPPSRVWRAGTGQPFPARLSYPAGSGTITTLSTVGPLALETTNHPFFTPLGENGRACVTCHQPADGMSIAAHTAREIWDATSGRDPLFAAVDGSNCPSLAQADRDSHSLLLQHGLFRIARPWPPIAADGTTIQPEFTLEAIRDPTGCNFDREYGLYSDMPTVSVFRRPRPAANLKYATGIGFSFDPKDGLPLELDRETGEPTSGNLLADARVHTLREQALDALVTHTAVRSAPERAVIDNIIAFETQLYTAQSADSRAGELSAAGALGGPDALAQAPAAQLQSSAQNPIWGEFAAWKEKAKDMPAPGDTDAGVDEQRDFRQSVARGAYIFANKQFLVTDSAGINDTGFGNPVRNSCAFCHNMLHAGLDVAPGQVDLGTANLPHANSQPYLPLFRLTCTSEELAQPFLGRVVYTHDPGYALTTGKCLDIGKITAQSMRGLPGRAPYFSNGSAATLTDVIDYYDRRYTIKLTDQEKLDLLHLLEVL